MTSLEFWKYIASAKDQADGVGDRPAKLRIILAALAPAEIIEFAEQYTDQINNAYTWNLWGAAFVMMGGCSDDSFDYFRDWLISEGKEIFDQALIEPESLALLSQLSEPALEEMRYIAGEVYEQKTGKQLPLRKREYLPEPSGEEWDEETVDAQFPELAKIYW